MFSTCVVDSTQMPWVQAQSTAPFSAACQNIMLEKNPFYWRYQICGSDQKHNTCTVAATTSSNMGAITCAQFCSSYPGMQCIGSNYGRTGTGNLCLIDTNFPSATCNSKLNANTSSQLCTCGFKPKAPQMSQYILPLFANNQSYCPAYPPNVASYNTSALASLNKHRQLNDQDDNNDYGRWYKKLTISIDYDAVKADGSAKITGINTEWDTDGWDTDTYNTDTPEMCTGLESHIRPGDPPGKCSFGHRPGNLPSNNCYGKLYAMNFTEASDKCAARNGHLAKVDTLAELQSLYDLFVNDDSFGIGLNDLGGLNWAWDGYNNVPVDPSWFNKTVPYHFPTDWSWTLGDCTQMVFPRPGKPYLTYTSCRYKQTYLCEGIASNTNPPVGGDLLADEGGFCIWYYANQYIALPDDESGGFQNTELAYFLLTDPNQMSNKYELLFGELYSMDIDGHRSNWNNWRNLTRRQVGQNSDAPVFPSQAANYSYHCHYTPTNFGMARVYSQQHMLERLYTGSAYQHCFCGYKYLGNLVDRCDCTRSGEQSNNCLTEHYQQLYEETFHETGQYVSCNNCDNPSP